MKNIIIIISLILSLSSCAVIKIPTATGGSRSDGIVNLSYQYGSFEIPEVKWDEALKKAINRCKMWGYENAEPFAGTTSKCALSTEYGCSAWTVTAQYQCFNSQ